jgi:GNAT superfamily N-acetyltransferase
MGDGRLVLMAATVTECEVSQTCWNEAVALATGGTVWQDDSGLRWAWQPHNAHLMLSFPQVIDAGAAQRGLQFAREHNARIVGAWLSPTTDAGPLEAVGFERGWEPWWMAAPLSTVSEPDDPRVELCTQVPEYGADGQRMLSLARGEQPLAWHAAAREEGRLAGHAWTLVADAVAGIYDMEVWPAFQRRGLGRALLREVCRAARAAGATRAVLNATPEGERLYSAEGFAHVGRGVTYWHHLGTTS